MDSRRVMPSCAIAWRGLREACDGDGGSDGRADAGRARREGDPGAAEATSRRRGAGRPGAARGGVSGATSGRRSRPVAGGAGRTTRRATSCERARHRRKPVRECEGGKRGGARTRMGSRAGGGAGGLHAAALTSAARPPRPRPAKRPRIREQRIWGARSRAGPGEEAALHPRSAFVRIRRMLVVHSLSFSFRKGLSVATTGRGEQGK